jgi:hypothetical protein
VTQLIGYNTANSYLQRHILVQPDQDPNVLDIPFNAILLRGDMYDYVCSTKYRDLRNVVYCRGGRNQLSGLDVTGVFEEADSIRQYGPREAYVSDSYIQDLGQLAVWAKTWLDTNAYPQAQATFKMVAPKPEYQAGVWVRLFESPGTDDVITPPAVASQPTTIKDLRISNVKVRIQGDHIEQELNTVSPVPYLDQAIYRIGLHAQAVGLDAADQTGITPSATTYLRTGGTVKTESGDPSNPTIQFAGGDAVFMNVDLTFPDSPIFVYPPYANGVYWVGLVCNQSATVGHSPPPSSVFWWWQTALDQQRPPPYPASILGGTTTLTTPEPAGYNAFVPASMNGIQAGRYVTLGYGTPNYELVQVSSVHPTYFVIYGTSLYPHAVGEYVAGWFDFKQGTFIIVRAVAIINGVIYAGPYSPPLGGGVSGGTGGQIPHGGGPVPR